MVGIMLRRPVIAQDIAYLTTVGYDRPITQGSLRHEHGPPSPHLALADWRAAHNQQAALEEALMKSVSWFTRFTRTAARVTGHPLAFVAAFLLLLFWLLSGPIFNFSDSWQLVINTTTTIITFMMVFLIQSTQNRDTAAMHVKLDEIIRALDGAHNALLDLEELDESELERIRESYEELAAKARAELRKGRSDTGVQEVP
jgi:low affinity Fe/Cu permease